MTNQRLYVSFVIFSILVVLAVLSITVNFGGMLCYSQPVFGDFEVFHVNRSVCMGSYSYWETIPLEAVDVGDVIMLDDFLAYLVTGVDKSNLNKSLERFDLQPYLGEYQTA